MNIKMTNKKVVSVSYNVFDEYFDELIELKCQQEKEKHALDTVMLRLIAEQKKIEEEKKRIESRLEEIEESDDEFEYETEEEKEEEKDDFEEKKEEEKKKEKENVYNVFDEYFDELIYIKCQQEKEKRALDTEMLCLIAQQKKIEEEKKRIESRLEEIEESDDEFEYESEEEKDDLPKALPIEV